MAKADRDPLLFPLGRRVHALRRSQGLRMKELAEASGLSVRFLSELEHGRANIAVTRLASVASALGVALEQLIADGPVRVATPGVGVGDAVAAGPDADLSRPGGDDLAADLAADLALLDRAQLQRVRAFISELRSDPIPHITALLGVRGAGKSAVGQSLARRLDVPFVELDQRIEALAGLDLAEIFAIHGEPYYRQLELRALQDFLGKRTSAVLATGGSLVTHPECWALLRGSARTVWLQAHARDHWERVLAQGDDRPMRRHPQAFAVLEELLAERRPLYEQADQTVDTSGCSVGEVVEAILSGATSG